MFQAELGVAEFTLFSKKREAYLRCYKKFPLSMGRRDLSLRAHFENCCSCIFWKTHNLADGSLV